MSKPIHNAELQILLVKKYLSGEGSYRSLTAVHGISERSLRRWVLQYREQGENSFYRKEGNCRVSTDDEDQLNSYHTQMAYYTEYIKRNPKWRFAGIYADEGITGTQV